LKDPRFFFIVAEGSVEIQAILPTIRKKTGNIREFLCKKDKGDMVYAPSIRKLISNSNAKEFYEMECKQKRKHTEHKKNVIDIIDTVTIKSIVDSIILQLDWGKFNQKFLKQRWPDSQIDSNMLKAMMETNLNDYLENLPFLADLPNSKIEMIVRLCKYSVQREGSVICKEGDIGQDVFILLSGEVKVEALASKRMVELLRDSLFFSHSENKAVRFKDDVGLEGNKEKNPKTSQKKLNNRRKTMFEARSSCRREILKTFSCPGDIDRKNKNHVENPSHTIELSRLGPGDYFGEMATLIDLPRAATVTATTDVLMISLSKTDFRSILKAISPHLEKDFERKVKLHMLENLFQLKSPFLDKIDNEKIHTMAEKARIKEIEANIDIFKEGDDANSFYFVYAGNLEVKKVLNGEVRDIGLLYPGDYFGELALINEMPRLATISTKNRTVVLEISRQEFFDCFQDTPELIAEFLIRMKGKKVDIKSVLSHQKSKKVFKDYLVEYHGVENLLFYDEVISYERCYDLFSMKDIEEKATGIINKYLNEDSEFAVNVTSKMILDAQELVESKAYLRDSFSKPHHEIFKLMERDIFKRFRESKSFSKLMECVRVYDDLDIQLLS